MVVCHTIAEIKTQLSLALKDNRTIGFVPTMGALHLGHLKLLETARNACDILVSSIFVNPVQFNNPEDYALYPRDVDQDLEQMKAAGCDFVFTPEADELYPRESMVRFNFGSLEAGLEGAFRPGHFNGVALVLSKLFHIVRPDHAYFGQKDLQQAIIVRRLVEDLQFDIQIEIVPTYREADGLAFSSRNRRLNAEQRQLAPHFYEALQMTREAILNNEDIKATREHMNHFIQEKPGMELEYLEVVNADTLEPVEKLIPGQQLAICIAGYVGEVRLLDNIYLRDEE